MTNAIKIPGTPEVSAIKKVATGSTLFLRRASLLLVNKQTNQQLTIEGLRIKFSLEKNDLSEPNKGTIEIYNLSEKTRNLFNVPPEVKGNETVRGLYVELSAGYRDMTRVIFTGDASSQSFFQSPDWVTKLEVQDGGSTLRTKTFEKSYKDGFPVSQIIMDVVNSFGVPVGYIKPGITSERVKYGASYNGLNKDVMDQFARDYKFKWSIQNNSISIWDGNKGTAGSAVLLSPDSGLIGSPIKTDKGIRFDCFLIPLIVPGCTVRIAGCRSFNGDVIVATQKISGDLEGAEWKISCEGRQA